MGICFTLYYTVLTFNPLPDMPILSSTNSAANKDVKNMDKWGYSYLIE